MMNTRISTLTALAVATCIIVAPPLAAEQLSEFWQDHRTYFNQLSDEACDGDEAAYSELWAAALRDNNPVAQNDLAWVYSTERCDYYDEDDSRSTALQRQSANAGYPMAQKNFAARLIEGLGVDPDPELAHEFFQRAIDAGYGEAAVVYAGYLLDEEYLARDVKAARRLYEIASQKGADQDRLDWLAGKLEKAPASDTWTFEDGEAGWNLVKNGRVKSRVFLGRDVETGGYYFGMMRNSSDPMIHFMGVSVERGGKDIELDAGDCYANRCLSNYQNEGGSPGTQIRMPVPPGSEPAFPESLKSGNDVTFRYQTEKSLKQDNFFRNTMSLKGSRQAIEGLESATARPKREQPQAQVKTPKAPAASSTTEAPGGASATTYYQGDVEDGDILCPAAEVADFPSYFYSSLPPLAQEIFLNDPTKRIKPASTDFLAQAGTSLWSLENSLPVIFYKGGRAVGIRSTVESGAEVIKQYYEGSWDLTGDRGVTLHIQGNPSYQLGDRHIRCDGGTMALNTGVGAPQAGGGYVNWQMCQIAIACEWWYEEKPDQRKSDVKVLDLIEWSPGQVAPTALRWSEEEVRPR